jgi:hypothetical protein
MMGHDLMFDMEEARIGIAECDCAYARAVHGHGRGGGGGGGGHLFERKKHGI